MVLLIYGGEMSSLFILGAGREQTRPLLPTLQPLSRARINFLHAAYTSFAPLNEPPTEVVKLPFGLYWLFFKSSS